MRRRDALDANVSSTVDNDETRLIRRLGFTDRVFAAAAVRLGSRYGTAVVVVNVDDVIGDRRYGNRKSSQRIVVDAGVRWFVVEKSRART